MIFLPPLITLENLRFLLVFLALLEDLFVVVSVELDAGVVVPEVSVDAVVASASAGTVVTSASVVRQSGSDAFVDSEQSVQPVGVSGAVQATPSLDGRKERQVARMPKTRKIVVDLMLLRFFDQLIARE